MQVKNYYVECMTKGRSGGFSAQVFSDLTGKILTVSYSDITEKFYGDKIPQYVQKALIERAELKGWQIKFL